MIKHTKGPWACTYVSNWAHDYRITNSDGTFLPINSIANDRTEQRANANLIASAPELLESLQELIEAATHHQADFELALSNARKAISKALGA